jgi:hypothetical protein
MRSLWPLRGALLRPRYYRPYYNGYYDNRCYSYDRNYYDRYYRYDRDGRYWDGRRWRDTTMVAITAPWMRAAGTLDHSIMAALMLPSTRRC